jgi:hypothetical protein
MSVGQSELVSTIDVAQGASSGASADAVLFVSLLAAALLVGLWTMHRLGTIHARMRHRGRPGSGDSGGSGSWGKVHDGFTQTQVHRQVRFLRSLLVPQQRRTK